jgi:hypothetical protein
MNATWSKQFASVKGIPRGYLVLDERAQIINEVHEKAPIQIHPFSIMRYSSESGLLFDYVYATAHSGDRNHRGKLTRFFEKYRTEHDRQGEYLLAADNVVPMWSSWYNSPDELRRDEHGMIQLLQARVDDAVNGSEVIDDLLRRILGIPDIDTAILRLLSTDADIDLRYWYRGGAVAEEVPRLVNQAVRSNKLNALIQVTVVERAKHGLGP